MRAHSEPRHSVIQPRCAGTAILVLIFALTPGFATAEQSRNDRPVSLRTDFALRGASPYRLSIARSDYRVKLPGDATSKKGKKNQLGGMIEEHANAQGLDPDLVKAVVKAESGYQVDAVSPKGAIGLMQVMPATGQRFGVNDLGNANQNLKAGTSFLRHLLNRYDDLPLALAAYNAGEGAVEKYGNHIPPYPETQAYVTTVLRHYDERALPGMQIRRNYLDGARMDNASLMPFRLNYGTLNSPAKKLP